MAKETNQDYTIDSVDKEILGYLVANSRIPFAEIAKELIVSPGTIHARVRKMEEKGIIKKYSIGISYNDLGYRFTAYLGIFVDQTSDSENIVEELKKIPEVTVAHLVTGQYSVFCKIRTRDTSHGKDIIYRINAVSGILRTETMISLEETINSSEGLIRSIFDINNLAT
jgi:Lrp/AsnC family transcriptional regulator, regulator for asnA, asnC and gidA